MWFGTTNETQLGDGICQSNPRATPFILSDTYECLPHFYCPNVNASDPLSLPSMCPPTIECQRLRLQTGFCEPQGRYEPQVCPAGFFCPDWQTKKVCPAGSWCPTGSVQPKQCYPLVTYCPEGSEKQIFFGGLIVCILIDAIVFGMVAVTRWRRYRRDWKQLNEEKRKLGGRKLGIRRSFHSKHGASFLTTQASSSSLASMSSSGSQDVDETTSNDFIVPMPRRVSVVDVNLASLLAHYRRAYLDHNLSMHFEFDSLSLKLSSGKTILHDVSGRIVPGRLTAIMGPSGAGKSTFMNVLMGKIKRTGGSLKINAVESSVHDYKKIIGYVPQDDIMLSELTVRETIEYSAKIRLPKNWSSTMIQNFVNDILAALDLSHVANNLVTSISGGQRKRVNIGIELCSAPMCLMVDEPTSGTSLSLIVLLIVKGLDATGALKIAQLLKKCAVLINNTVVAVIHQPRHEAFQEFDDIILLAPGGQTAYAGPRSGIQLYFEKLGFVFDLRQNSADVIMDILSGKGQCVLLHDEKIFSEMIKEQCSMSEAAFNLAKSGALATIEYSVSDLVGKWKEIENVLGQNSENDPPVQPIDIMSSMSTVDKVPKVSSSHSTQVRANDTNLESIEVELPPGTFSSYKTRYLSVNSLSDVMAQALLLATEKVVDPPTSILQEATIASTTEFHEKQPSTRKTEYYPRYNPKKLITPDPESLVRLKQACAIRGAGFFKQIHFAHGRSIVQQYRRFNAFILEIFVACCAGILMGIALRNYNGALYQGLLVRPYTLISPSANELVVPIISMLIGCAIGLSGAPAGVKIFSEETQIYWREAAAGHRRFAYYLGKNLSSLYRIFVASLHFTSLFVFLACPQIDFFKMYTITFFQFFAVYGLSFVVAMLVKRENAALFAVCACMFTAVLSGNAPNIQDARKIGFEWLLDMSFNRWATEAWYSEELILYDGVYEIYDVSAQIFGYTLNRFWMDILWMAVIGFVLRIMAFFLMVGLNRQKQR